MRPVARLPLSRVLSGCRGFHSQHRTPVLPQVPAAEVQQAASESKVRVAYLLHRQPVVKPTPHPLEMEMAFLLQREHQRYSRHESSESATHFMAQRGQSIDALNRTDPRQIQSNFFGLELYQDAMRVVLQRYKPERRVTPRDLWDPATYGSSNANSNASSPPTRHSLHRKLDDYLHLIVRDEASGKWTVPQTELRGRETLRMAAERAIATDNGEGLDCYVWSNAPQATVPNANDGSWLFIYVATYLSGRPKFSEFRPKTIDHAWVTRHEMMQYEENFQSPELVRVLLDISADSTFES
ncbi:hypothetical protein, conserved [Trypanosoma brucei gambiense DAL972]|uniref:Large ribosomal subunit protein mL46 n=2 Tax=Trypanosoma brucei TaxID=5691 RepID=C9ZT91_TRYB9|nr:hypothetical protein, conserved [Trypanosoma brucei gambiense DAL972]RHW71287.1 39S mitochondrial ribosomal protein L46 [Trypanosoma brucei equiperdum]6HIV_Aj Chain Aj, mL46 [Trypanosoma brucei brucei]6HIX_Aj Chain Aj, ml46 [Trypanosoma brucei brucei]CBH12626.1 hypothetical protein, conserved [Trypanosoma brucei gambiense DAL972]|eukprot:XP_011774906.1 hypothetical protein, conserved [Trypanosoma brucei gambiense DAL972]